MKKVILFGMLSAATFTVAAQHEHHMPAQSSAKDSSMAPMKHDNMPHHDMNMMNHEDMDMMDHGSMGMMSHSFSRNLPMNRNSSGTAWLPDNSPMYGYMIHTPKWMFMIHDNVFLRYTNHDIARVGSRGAYKFDAPNWVMGMGQRQVGERGLFRFNVMMSLDPLTEGGSGYPLLFQSGESWKGKPLVDRQHPHDLFAELSVAYTYMINKDADVFVYLAYPGEPAISAPTFMHRPSALFNPDAPLGHHWQDATHITFGVATVGVRYKNFKLEGSSFTGREPDEDRYNFDKARFDSWSARLSYNPTAEWALQVSQGFIKSPEALHPDEDVYRTTASVINSKKLNNDGMINSTLVWGYNRSDSKHKEHSVLLESAWSQKKNAIYGRYEFVEKSGEELNLNENIVNHDEKFPVNAVTAGVNRNVFAIGKTNISIGAQATFYFTPRELENLYGKNPWSFETFIRISPGLMK